MTGIISPITHSWQPIAFPSDALVDSSAYGSTPFFEFNLTNGTTLSITWSAPAGEMFVVTPPPVALGPLQLRFGLGGFPFIGGGPEYFSASSVTFNLVFGTAPATYGEIVSYINGWDCSASSTIAPTNSSFAFTSITLTQQFTGSGTVTMSSTLNWEPYSIILFGGNTNDPTDPGPLLTLQPYNAIPPTPPTLNITTISNLPALVYPQSGANFTLQMTTNLASGNWVTVSNAVPLIAVQITNAPANVFFRLH